MAKKEKTVFVCGNCGHEEPKWAGRCPECGEWNSFHETSGKMPEHRTSDPVSMPLSSIPLEAGTRIDCGMEETDRVLGGGLMRGSSVLVGGEPGIGKSTLLFQIASSIQTKGRILYISGEESPAQIRIRAERLGVNNPRIDVLCEVDVDAILRVLNSLKPVVIVVDSIQTLISREAGMVPGTMNQIKYSCHEIISWAKEHSASVFLIAHVTKEGAIAGPKVIEHLVDTVLYFEQAQSDLRILKSVKNRFGSVDEIGLFIMKDKGLIQVKNPSSLFLVQREGSIPPGIAVASVYEGTRALLVEIQALTVPAKSGFSRIFSDRIDSGRVSRISAVLEKHIDLRFSDQDIYVNVAGGIKLSEVGIEFPLALALYSARTGIPVPVNIASAGEISLAGELRPIAHMKRRIRTAAELGFSVFIGPTGVLDESDTADSWERMRTLKEGIQKTFSRGGRA